jgi:hypothetical protein
MSVLVIDLPADMSQGLDRSAPIGDIVRAAGVRPACKAVAASPPRFEETLPPPVVRALPGPGGACRPC